MIVYKTGESPQTKRFQEQVLRAQILERLEMYWMRYSVGNSKLDDAIIHLMNLLNGRDDGRLKRP